jgi:hypothetical protein
MTYDELRPQVSLHKEFAFAPKSASSLLVSGKARNIRRRRKSPIGLLLSILRRGWGFLMTYDELCPQVSLRMEFAFAPKSASSLLVSGKARNIRHRRKSPIGLSLSILKRGWGFLINIPFFSQKYVL